MMQRVNLQMSCQRKNRQKSRSIPSVKKMYCLRTGTYGFTFTVNICYGWLKLYPPKGIYTGFNYPLPHTYLATLTPEKKKKKNWVECYEIVQGKRRFLEEKFPLYWINVVDCLPHSSCFFFNVRT